MVDKLLAGRAPAWSPDGGKIAFTVYKGGNPVVGVADTDGTDRTLLGQGIAPLWTLDGRVVLFAYGDDMNMHAMNADGSGLCMY